MRASAPLALLLSGLALALAGCGDVEVGTDVEFPKPLVDELPMTVGVYYSEEFTKYTHAEQRWGTEWKVELGKFHVRMSDRLFESAFRDTVPVKNLSELPSERPLRAVIEPRIEQYSFITPRDTGAKYYAVTIRYRLNVFAPDGRLADSLTFTGYGSSPSSGMTSTNPMILATKAAMRDAAAKFLVQFPEQPVTKKMIAELPLIEEPKTAVAGANAPATPIVPDDVEIESVPIVDAQTPAPPADQQKKAGEGTGEAPAGAGTPTPTNSPPPSGTGTPAPIPPKTDGSATPAPPKQSQPQLRIEEGAGRSVTRTVDSPE